MGISNRRGPPFASQGLESRDSADLSSLATILCVKELDWLHGVAAC